MLFDVQVARQRGPFAGSLLSIALHAAALVVALLLARKAAPRPVEVVPEVVFRRPPPAPPRSEGRPPKTPPRHDRRLIVRPDPAPPPPEESPARPETLDEEPPDDGPSTAAPTGVATAAAAGELRAVGSAPRGFEPGLMVPPVRLSGPDPEYTEDALEREVEGTLAIRCIVSTEGLVSGCRVLQGLPYLDRAAVEALERRRYTPARLQNGQAVEVEYTFRIQMRLAR